MTFPVEGTPERADFALRLGGADAGPLLRLDVLEVDVSEEVGRHARATLLVRNWDPDTREVAHSDAETFKPGTEVELSMGWQGELVPVFSGLVTAVTGHFGAASGPTLEVACRSRSTLLASIPCHRVYEQTSDGDVAADLASLYGLTADAEDGATQPVATWAGVSDWDWLVTRAARLGWVTYVRERSLVFRPAAEPGDDDLRLAYGTTLRELHVTQDLAGLPGPVTVHGWSADLEPVTAEAESGVEETGWPLRAAETGTPARIGQDEAGAMAAARAGAAKRRQVSGSGRTLGTPRLRCDSWLTIEGVGQRLGGSHYVSAARHRLGRNGFTTEFQLGAPPPLLPPIGTAGAAATLAAGVVDDLDDPESQGRVKVRFPYLPAADAVWARLALLDAGPSQGTFFVPDVGQEVVVGWLDEDRRFPVVLGSLWNATQTPPETVEPANDLRAIVTRSGHRLAFDDKDSGTVTVRTKGGHELLFDDGSGDITMTEKNGTASVTVGGGGVTIEATSGDIALKAPAGKVSIEAMQLDAAATGPAKLRSSATLDLTASATLTASGALVRIN